MTTSSVTLNTGETTSCNEFDCQIFFFSLCNNHISCSQNQPPVPHGNHTLRCPPNTRYKTTLCVDNVPVNHELFDTSIFCAADPKEAITFLEKTKEKVSPETSQSLV